MTTYRLKTSIVIILLVLFVVDTNLIQYPFEYDRKLCKSNNSELDCLKNQIMYWIKYNHFNDCYLTKIDEKGTPTGFHELLLDVYVVDSNFTNNEVVKVVEDVNLIWKDYGIQFVKNDVLRIENKILKPIFRNNEDYLKFGRDIVGEDKLHDRVIDVIFTEEIKPGIDGKFVDNTALILVSTQSKNISSITAHEMGHILNLYDKAYFSGEYNLMIRGGCIRDRYYPTVLNQKQVDDAVAAARPYERSQAK